MGKVAAGNTITFGTRALALTLAVVGVAALSGCAQPGGPIGAIVPGAAEGGEAAPQEAPAEGGPALPIPLLPGGSGAAPPEQTVDIVAGPPLSPGIEIDSTDLELFAQNQDAVLDRLIGLANLEAPLENGSEDDWRLVVEAAMVFADQRCEKYVEARYQAPDGVYQLGPSAIRAVIKDKKVQYRESLGSDAFQSRPAAMNAIQGYMALCTPATAEGGITSAITTGGAPSTAPLRPAAAEVPRATRRGPTLGLRDEAPGIYEGGDESFIVDYGLGITNAISDAERALTLEEGQQIQLALCVASDGNFGRQGSRTRQAIGELQGVLGFEQTGLLTKDQASALLSMAPCPQDFLTYYERITFTTPQAVQQLQRQLNLQLAEVGISIQLSGILDDSTREAVKMVKRRAGMRATSAVTAEFASEVLAGPSSRGFSSGGTLPPAPQ